MYYIVMFVCRDLKLNNVLYFSILVVKYPLPPCIIGGVQFPRSMGDRPCVRRVGSKDDTPTGSVHKSKGVGVGCMSVSVVAQVLYGVCFCFAEGTEW